MWIEGRLLADNAPCFLPFELVHADFTVPRPPSSGNFLLSTNGLASGNTVTEAILHGVCEVIERDATTLHNLNRQFDETRRLDLDSIDDGDCLTLVEMIHTADLTLAVWDITSDIAITTFRCQIMENARGAHAITLPAEGYGCHPNRTVALVRAITEAAQSRVTAISGARDDMRPNLYGLGDDPTLLENWRHILKSTKGDHKFQDIQTAELKTTDEELRLVLSKLSAAGFIDIITVDISPFPAELCAVVRVVIPGLEGPMHGAYLPGSRGLPSARPIP